MAPARKQPVRKVAIYARQSRQKESISVPMQLRRCQETAASEGWVVAAEYADRGKSGYAEGVRREGYEQMIADLEAGRFDAVLVYKADRLRARPRDGPGTGGGDGTGRGPAGRRRGVPPVDLRPLERRGTPHGPGL